MNNAAASLLQMSQMISRHKTGSRLIFEAFKKAAQADYCDPGGGGGLGGGLGLKTTMWKRATLKTNKFYFKCVFNVGQNNAKAPLGAMVYNASPWKQSKL